MPPNRNLLLKKEKKKNPGRFIVNMNYRKRFYFLRNREIKIMISS